MRHLVFGKEEIDEEAAVATFSPTVRDDGDSSVEIISSSQRKIVSIAKLIQDRERKREKFISLELFPSKKADNEVYERFFSEVSGSLSPLFYALTWHEDCRSSGGNYLPLETLRQFPDNTLLHIAAKKLRKSEAVKILNGVIAQGKNNIFVLRGDDCTTTGDFPYASDLVEFIRKHYGSKFDICVAGYPQMHPESSSKEEDLTYLKKKVDAGANFIISQIFFDSKIFVEFVRSCRSRGITVPIIPGIFPIPNYRSLQRMATLCSVEIPHRLLNDLQPIKDNDEAVRAYGISLARKLITDIFESGAANGFHLFTLNSSSIALEVCEKLSKCSSL